MDGMGVPSLTRLLSTPHASILASPMATNLVGSRRVRRHPHHRPRSAPRAASPAVPALNGSASSEIFWNVGSSATLGTGSSLAGNIIADQSISLKTRASIFCRRAIALVGAVTLDTNQVSNNCFDAGALESGLVDFGSQGFAGASAAVAVPEPASLMIFGIALGLLAVTRRSEAA